MKVIGVTGGVGAGKSELLHSLEAKYNCRVIFSDDVANKIKEKGEPSYDALTSLLGTDILTREADGTFGEIDRKKMAAAIFGKPELLSKVNAILHPATNGYILQQIEEERKSGRLALLFIEAALLIESGYNKIVDEMWYVYTSEEVRRKRLKASRGYSDEKITQILEAQLSEEEFQKNTDFMIDNSGTLEDSRAQIDRHIASMDLTNKI